MPLIRARRLALPLLVSALVAGPFVTAPPAGATAPADLAPRIRVGDATVVEPATGSTAVLSFPLILNQPAPADVSVGYATKDGSATAKEGDYTARANSQVTIPAGASTGVITVTVKGTGLPEKDETLTVSLGSVSGAVVADGVATGTIINPTGPASVYVSDTSLPVPTAGTATASFAISVSPSSTVPVTVKYRTVDGTAKAANGDYTAATGSVTFPAGSTSQTVGVTVSQGTAGQANKTFSLAVTPPAGLNAGDGTGVATIVGAGPAPKPHVSIGDSSVAEPASGTTTLTFPVALDQSPTSTVKVPWKTVDGTATAAGGDYSAGSGTLVLPAGTTTGVISITVAATGKAVPAETFKVNLGAPTNATLADTSATGTILTGTTWPSAQVSDPVITEPTSGSGILPFVVTLNPAPAAGQTVTVGYTTTDGSASAAGGDYTPASGTLTFTGAASQEVDVVVPGDADNGVDQTVGLTLTSVSSNARLASASAVGTVLDAAPGVALTPLVEDPFTNPTSQHATEVEPDTFAYGSTVVAAFQTGRFFDGGGSDIGWATSGDAGSTWSTGFLPSMTPFSTPSGPFGRISDPTVAYDAAHRTWLIGSLGLGAQTNSVLVSRSTDGARSWSAPVSAAPGLNNTSYDKDWVACDNTATSPFYGHCYVTWDDNRASNLLLTATSSDGGLTWSAPAPTADSAHGIGGQPVVQPNGTVIVPVENGFGLIAYRSTDGGATWSASVTVSGRYDRQIAGGALRSEPLPSAETDANGRVFMVWHDCRFRTGCTSNDILFSTSDDGVTWSAVTRVPIDPVGSTVDHFIPGLAVDPATSGSGAHLALTYYYLPDAACDITTCRLSIGAITSTDGGSTWSAPKAVTASPMHLDWLADTTQGRMVGDYMSTSWVQGTALAAVAIATAPDSSFHEHIAAVTVAS